MPAVLLLDDARIDLRVYGDAVEFLQSAHHGCWRSAVHVVRSLRHGEMVALMMMMVVTWTGVGRVHLVEADESFYHAVWIVMGTVLSVVGGCISGFPELLRGASLDAHYWSDGGGFGGGIFAVRAVLDDKADGFFDPDPVESLGDCGGRFVDAAMLLCMYLL